MIRRLLIALCILMEVCGASARTSCSVDAYGNFCTSQVDFNQFFQTAYQTQQATEWCWAASISMLFAYYGHPVNQSRIVQEAYGSVVNMPGSPAALTGSLNRTWSDDNGVAFHSTVDGLYDATSGIGTVNNSQLINELAQDRPFIVGTGGHAMVVTEMSYYQTPTGPYLVDIGVFDPWPTSPAARSLSTVEATPVSEGGSLSYIATAQVDSGSGSSISNPMQSDQGGGGAVDWVSLAVLALTVGLGACMRRRV